MSQHLYRRDVLDRLWVHGIQPKDTTPPELVREFVNDLYRYELRRLRARLRRKEFPKGGYFGRRPDPAALERSLAAYLRVRRADDYEALEMMTHLDCELIPAAARQVTPGALAELRTLRDRIDSRVTPEQRMAFEDDFHAIVFRIVDRPLI